MRYIFTLLFLFTALSAVEYKPLVLGADGKTRQFPDGEQLRTVPTYGLDASKPAAATANTGMIYCATDSQKIYRSNGSSWILFSVGQIGSSNIGAAPNAQGLTITGTSINLEPASASFGGVVTTGTQVFAGAKTFDSATVTSAASPLLLVKKSGGGNAVLALDGGSGSSATLQQRANAVDVWATEGAATYYGVRDSVSGVLFFQLRPGAVGVGYAEVLSTLDAASTSSAALRVSGGVGIGKKLIVGSTITTAAATTAIPSLNIPHGTAPSSPVNGDVWSTTSGFFGRVNGSTVGPFSAGGITGTLTSGRVPFATGASSITDASKMVYDSATGFNVNQASSGANNLTLGTSAGDSLTSGANNVMIGKDAGTTLTTSTNCVFIGSGAGNTATPTTGSVIVGGTSGQSMTGSNNVIVGANNANAANSGTGNAIFGPSNSWASGVSDSYIFGGANYAAFSSSIIIGGGTQPTATNQLVVGGNAVPILDAYIGRGVTHTTLTNIAINPTGGEGTDKAGSALRLAGGRSTGSGVGGSIIIQTSPAGASSATPNTLVDRITIDSVGDLIINTVGRGLRVKEGSNAKMGTSTLVAGTVVVSTTAVAATSRIFLTSQSDGGTVGFQRVSARTASTSFTITSSSGTDTSTIAWFIVEPSP